MTPYTVGCSMPACQSHATGKDIDHVGSGEISHGMVVASNSYVRRGGLSEAPRPTGSHGRGLARRRIVSTVGEALLVSLDDADVAHVHSL
jgi:hypothetical protein